MTRLSPQRTFTLYLLVVSFVFVSFILGLLIGTGSIQRGQLIPAESSYKPAEDLETQLNFYDELSKPVREEEYREPALPSPEVPKSRPEAQVVEGPESPAERSSEKTHTIQVAALSNREEAEQLLIRLNAKGFEGQVREPESGTGDVYFRVWVGEFTSPEEAESYAAQLKEEGFHTYIRRIP